jgi:glycosyltransferase involved in cell wall biosynthesis
MKASVIIPLYNKVLFIKEAIHSVISQTIQDFEIIVVNDGSTDESEVVVTNIKDPRIRIISQKNAGVAAARNNGIFESTSDFIAFLDADDYWEPDHLEVLLSLKKDYPQAGLYSTGYKSLYRGQFINHHVKNNLFCESKSRGSIDSFKTIHSFASFLQTSSCGIRKSLFDKVGYFNTHVIHAKYSTDMDLFHRIELMGYQIVYAPGGFSIYHADRSELARDVALNLHPSLKDQVLKEEKFINCATYLSDQKIENPQMEFYVTQAKTYINSKKYLLIRLWTIQIYFIAVFILQGDRSKAWKHFCRTYKYYERFPWDVRLILRLIICVIVVFFPNRVVKIFYNSFKCLQRKRLPDTFAE